MSKEDIEALRELLKESGKEYYEVTMTLQPDDDTEIEKTYFFEKPKTPVYDRYVKTASASASKALKIFCEETVCEEQREELKAAFEEYPAQPLSIGEKLMAMLGLAKVSTVKKL